MHGVYTQMYECIHTMFVPLRTPNEEHPPHASECVYACLPDDRVALRRSTEEHLKEELSEANDVIHHLQQIAGELHDAGGQGGEKTSRKFNSMFANCLRVLSSAAE